MDTQWKRELRRLASAHGMCAENRRLLEYVDTKADAISLYKKTIDWALEEDYPGIDMLRRAFSDCESEGVFVDRQFNGEILDAKQVYVFHNCKGTICVRLNVSEKIIPMLYFANGCKMTVRHADGDDTSIRVPLYVFGDNEIFPEQSESMQCSLFKFEVK